MWILWKSYVPFAFKSVTSLKTLPFKLCALRSKIIPWLAWGVTFEYRLFFLGASVFLTIIRWDRVLLLRCIKIFSQLSQWYRLHRPLLGVYMLLGSSAVLLLQRSLLHVLHPIIVNGLQQHIIHALALPLDTPTGIAILAPIRKSRAWHRCSVELFLVWV